MRRPVPCHPGDRRERLSSSPARALVRRADVRGRCPADAAGMTSTPAAPPRVLIAGSGVAAVEAILALRHLAGHRIDIAVLAPSHAFVNRPAAVAEPFGFGAPPPLDLGELATRYAVELIPGELAGVTVASHTARVAGGADQRYDHLLVAVGARPVEAVQGALTFAGPDDVPAVARLLDDAARGKHHKIAIAIPAATIWPLPAYELAVMATTELRMRGASQVEVIVVTPEREPLWLFGAAAGEAMREMLRDRGIRLQTGALPARFADRALWLQNGDAIAADAVLALPRLEGPRIPGLPADGHGFLPTDAHGVVTGAPGLFAAGDATSFPVHQA